MEYTAAVLRNKGVQVEAAVLSPRGEDGELPSRSRDKDGSVKIETRWVRFDANAIADIEEQFGSLAKFEASSRETPFNAIRRALAIVWVTTSREAGMMMLDGHIGEYSTAVGVALSIANGVDPTQAARLLRVGVSATRKLTEERQRQLEEALEEAEAEERRGDLTVVEGGKEGEEETAAAATAEPDSTPKADSPGTDGSPAGSEPDETTPTSGVTHLPRSSSPSKPSTEPTPEEETAPVAAAAVAADGTTSLEEVGARSS